MSSARTIRIGGASGYWGDSAMAVPQLLGAGDLDYLVFDYLAEITMSILARARAKNPEAGFATDFISFVMTPHLAAIARQGVKVISNAGGVNPDACARAVRGLIEAAGLDLKVAVVHGDDLMGRAQALADMGPEEMFSGDPLPDRERLASVNAYLGAFPIAEALARGADVVITGRGVDSATTLGACIHGFGWGRDDLDQLAGASLAGHILECGPQATGGNFTDWAEVADSLDSVGYPIAEVEPDGSFVVTKPPGSGGAVTVGTVGEQMLYEIGDPQAYILPDVVCDFSAVTLEQQGEGEVRVAGAKGRPAPDSYKVSATYADGWRAGLVWFFYGEDAAAKARSFADAGLKRARRTLQAFGAPDYSETSVELIGDESVYGDFARATATPTRSVAVKIAAKHFDQRAAGLLLKEVTGLGLSAPPGLSGFAGGRPKPSPVVRLFSFTVAKAEVPVELHVEGEVVELPPEPGTSFDPAALPRPTPPPEPDAAADMVPVPLIKLAWARSGDKGDKANIGVLPRRLDYAPYIWAALTESEVEQRFAHYLQGRVERFFMPGTGAINFVLDQVLGGGGVASLRNDPQGKGYSQILLQTPIPVPRSIAETVHA